MNNDIIKYKKLGILKVTKKIGISSEELRYWEKLGVVKPEHLQCGERMSRKYSEEDIHRAVVVKALVDTGKYALEDAIRKLSEGDLSRVYLEKEMNSPPHQFY